MGAGPGGGGHGAVGMGIAEHSKVSNCVQFIEKGAGYLKKITDHQIRIPKPQNGFRCFTCPPAKLLFVARH